MKNFEEHSAYTRLLKLSMDSIVAIYRMIQERYGDNIPMEQLIFLQKDLQNHHQLLGKGSDLYKHLHGGREG